MHFSAPCPLQSHVVSRRVQGLCTSTRTYFLRQRDKAPINQRLSIGGRRARIEGAIGWNDADIAIVLLVEPPRFDHGDTDRGVGGQLSSQSESRGPAAYDDIIERRISGDTKGLIPQWRGHRRSCPGLTHSHEEKAKERHYDGMWVRIGTRLLVAILSVT